VGKVQAACALAGAWHVCDTAALGCQINSRPNAIAGVSSVPTDNEAEAGLRDSHPDPSGG
jgi:hypothetical protein